MPRPENTEIRIDEEGTETHESWLLVRANHISGRTHLFDSEVAHTHYIEVNISRCKRKRDLNRDWLHETTTLLSFDMSQAQWGAFVSSFGKGTGVPATLSRYFAHPDIPNGLVPQAPFKARLEESHREVREAGERAFEEIKAAQKAVQEAFDQNLGKKEMRKRLDHLQSRISLAPDNMEFAAKSLTEHTENVVTKARGDIEGMMLMAAEGVSSPQIGPGTSRMIGTGDGS